MRYPQVFRALTGCQQNPRVLECHIIKSFCKIIFLDFYTNVSNKSSVKENVLVRSTVTGNSFKLTFFFLKEYGIIKLPLTFYQNFLVN